LYIFRKILKQSEGKIEKAMPSHIRRKFAMTTKLNNASIGASSEYTIGHTTYVVQTVFCSSSAESLSDILKRLIVRDTEKIIGEKRQESDKLAV